MWTLDCEFTSATSSGTKWRRARPIAIRVGSGWVNHLFKNSQVEKNKPEIVTSSRVDVYYRTINRMTTLIQTTATDFFIANNLLNGIELCVDSWFWTLSTWRLTFLTLYFLKSTLRPLIRLHKEKLHNHVMISRKDVIWTTKLLFNLRKT